MEIIDSFFNPKSIALIGATDRENSIGKIVMDNLLIGEEKRTVYPINPNRETILGRKCYPDVTKLPETPEMAIIVTPAATVADAVEKCARAGTKAIVIASAGFKEAGPEGIAREENIAKIGHYPPVHQFECHLYYQNGKTGAGGFSFAERCSGFSSARLGGKPRCRLQRFRLSGFDARHRLW